MRIEFCDQKTTKIMTSERCVGVGNLSLKSQRKIIEKAWGLQVRNNVKRFCDKKIALNPSFIIVVANLPSFY